MSDGVTGLGTEYFGPSGQAFMVNFRVASLDAVLERLRAPGRPPELWEPAEGM